MTTNLCSSKFHQASPCLQKLINSIAGMGLKTHSGQVEPGDIFIAMPGVNIDGSKFIAQAISNGAAYIVATATQLQDFTQTSPDRPSNVEFCPIADSRDALALLAMHKFNTNNLKFPVIGITGTNGKTSISYLFEHLYKYANKKVGVMGTVNYRWPGFLEKAPLTTPDCLSVHSMLAAMRDQGNVDAAFLEVSSHALDQKRVLGLQFDGAIFINLTQDHLDYHVNMENYFQAKTKLFFSPYSKQDQIAVINLDDGAGRRLVEILPEGKHIITFGLEQTPQNATHNHLKGEIISSSTSGLHLRMCLGDATWELKTPLIGSYNASNLLAVQAMALQLGFSADDFECFKNFTGTPGRMERVLNPQGLHIFVDYAHTPDALINVQKELKKVGFKRLITVFGCGGNRDRSKRPLMGQAVASFADIAVLTSDNPRCEDPQAILDDVRPGLANCKQVIEEIDRKKAILRAIELTGAEDALLVAGKGHEDYQIIGNQKFPFSDQQTIQEILLCR